MTFTSFNDINGNLIDLSSSQKFIEHACAQHSCVDAIVQQFNNDFYYFLRGQEELNIIDLGANVGLFSLYVYPVAEKIFAVEPTPSHFDLLNELVKLTNKQNIECHQLAIGVSDSEVDFHIHKGNSTMNSFIKHRTNHHSDVSIKVKTQTLNTFIDTLNLASNVGFVKMDIEGFENEVIFESSFEDAVKKIDALYVEIHDFDELGKMEQNFNKIKERFLSWGKSVDKLQFDGILVY